MQYWSASQRTWYAVCSRCSRQRHDLSATARPHLWCVGDTAPDARPRTRVVQNRGAKVQSALWQHAAISGASYRRRWPARSARFAVSKYQPPSRAAHQTVYCWQPCLSSCRSSSLEQSVRGRRLIVTITDFPPSIENSSFFNFHRLTWFFDRLTASLEWSL